MKLSPIPKKMQEYITTYPCLFQVMLSTAGGDDVRWLVLHEYGDIEQDAQGGFSRKEIRQFSYRESDEISLAKAFGEWLKPSKTWKHSVRAVSVDKMKKKS